MNDTSIGTAFVAVEGVLSSVEEELVPNILMTSEAIRALLQPKEIILSDFIDRDGNTFDRKNDNTNAKIL
jgi:hypothetical protein